MNQRTIFTALMILGALSTSTLTSAQTTPGDSPKSEAAPATAVASASGDKVSELRDWLALPTDKLVAIAQEQGFQALAELRSGRRMARFETREKNLEQFRIDLLAQAEAADQQRAELFKRVEEEVEQIRQQFAEDQAECANQIRIVIQQHRDAILTLKAGAEGCRQLAGQTDAHLKAIRPRLLALRRDHRVTAEGQFTMNRPGAASPTSGVIDSSLIATLTSDLQTLGLEDGLAVDKPSKTAGVIETRVMKPSGTVEQALGELDSLK